MDDFAQFFAATRDGVFRVVLAATGDRTGAEDAVAEAYARAYTRWTAVGAHPNPTAWVLRTALNVQRSVWRRLRREVLSADPPESPPAEGGPLTGPVDRRVRDAVRALPRRQREVLALRVLADLSADEAAGVLGVAPATVHVHLHRALGTLRARLDADGDPGSGRAPRPRRLAVPERSAEWHDAMEFHLIRWVRHAH